MKKIVLFSLVLALMISMAGCSCDHQWAEATCIAPKTCTRCGETEGAALSHTSGEERITTVDTENLTITYELSCARCGAVMETRESATSIPPVDGLLPISPDEWFACLTTNIYNLGATQILVPQDGESEDNALIHGIVSINGMKAAITFNDAEGTTITTDQRDERKLVHTIQVDAHFTNDTASEFFKLLMLLVMNHNDTLDVESAGNLAGQIMSGVTVSDNGFTYDMAITSIADQMVRLDIIAE